MPQPLTKLERRILDYLIEYLREHTYQPSIREIGRRFDIKSTKTVSEYLQALAEKGWIERDPSRSRGVKLLGVDLGLDTVSVPHYADEETRAAAEGGQHYTLDRRLAGTGGTFFMTMRGESMTGVGIRDGDLLLCEPAGPEELEEGDVVVARVDAESTVKRYWRRGNDILLEPANVNYPPMLVTPDEVELVGRVISVLRRLRVPGAMRGAAEPQGGGDASD